VLIDQPLPHPPGRVALLARRCPVGLEPPDDQRLPRIQHVGQGGGIFRAGGTADTNASRTVRR
jgi:hypothetical protein